MTRARTDVSVIQTEVLTDWQKVRSLLPPVGTDPSVDDAIAGVETFLAIALRVLAKTNPSKIRSEARTVELSTLIPPVKP